MEKEKYTYKDLLNIIQELRGEKGCPWDKVQTHTSLLPHLLEESYELVEAIQNEDMANVKEELGDVLLQVLMHAQIAKEEGEFTIEEVIHEIANKLVYRHPHVFKDKAGIDTPEKVMISWEAIKKEEKNEKTPVEAMERVAKALPALIRTQKVQKKAIKDGLVKDNALTVLSKVLQEVEELKSSIQNGEVLQIEEELGDLLFDIANLSTFFEINAEFALTKSVEKFINRFRYIENSRVEQ